MNAEHRMNPSKPIDYDLEERLLEYAARVTRLAEHVSDSQAGRHVAGQFLRSGTAALPNHAEAQAAESPADFVHKLKLSLKELRETYRWLRLVQRVPLVEKPERVDPLLKEIDELIRIFVSSIRTAEKNALTRTALARTRASANVQH